jgi:purine-binding chemotaxis protein CheW
MSRTTHTGKRNARGTPPAKAGRPPEGPAGKSVEGAARPPATTAPRGGTDPAARRVDSAGSRITLPPSGLAEDILAREEARAVEAAPLPAREAAPAPLAARPESLAFLMAPAREERKPVEAHEHLVTFLLGDEEYGLDVRLVQEIIRLTEITPVPRAPEFVKGVINLRGRIIPVVDLKHRLTLGHVDGQSRAARIVVAKLRERLVGLLVDGASQVLKVPLSLIEPAPEEVVEVDVDYIRGVAKLENRLVILMDLTRILGLDAETMQASA